jgi:hypothetical protein
MKQLMITIAAGLCSLITLAQTDTTTVLPAADTTKPVSTFTIGASYADNANYYGQKAEEKIPYMALAATYKNKSGLYLSGLAYKLLNDTGKIASAGSLGAGFDFKLSKRWSADISYSHTFYAAYSPFLQASSPDNASASFQYENWVTTKVNFDYAFGKTSDYFITVGISKQINLGSISSRDIITITPSVDVVAGTQHFYQTYLTEKKLRDSVLGIILVPITGQPTSQPTSKTTSITEVNLLSYSFKCPLAYNRSRYMIELAYQLSVLSNHVETKAGSANSFLTASFYYQF